VSESDYIKYRGKCKEMCQELIAKDPTLTLVRGHYYDAHWGVQPHWWCIKPDGTIVDPTKDQFLTKGTGLYEPFSGNILCEECGKIVPEEKAIIAGNYAVCSNRCALNLVGLGDK
jgi:hypothetical protein